MSFNSRNNPPPRPPQWPRNSSSTGTTDHWAVAYFKANPIKVGTSAATLYGLIIIFGYHTYIEYDSSFDIHSLASLIFAAAYVGLLVLVGLSFGLFAPAYFIGAFCIDDVCRRTSNGVHRRIAKCFGVAFFAFAALFALVCLYGDKDWMPALIVLFPFIAYLLYALFTTPWRRLPQVWQTRLGVSRGSAWLITWKIRRFKAVWRNLPEQYKSKLWLGLKMAFICIFEVYALQIFFLIMRDSHFMQTSNVDWLEMARIALMVAMFTQIAGAYLVNAWRNPATPRKHRVFSIAVALFVPILLPLVAGESTPVFSLTSMLTKTGNFRATEMTLNDEGCRVASDLDRTLCVKTSDGTNKLCNVHIMSRIGSETYILLSYPIATLASNASLYNGLHVEKIGDRIVQHIYIPSKNILGIKPDLSVRVFTIDAIKSSLIKTSSICMAPKKSEVK